MLLRHGHSLNVPMEQCVNFNKLKKERHQGLSERKQINTILGAIKYLKYFIVTLAATVPSICLQIEA